MSRRPRNILSDQWSRPFSSSFQGHHYSSLTLLIQDFDCHYWQHMVAPFAARLNRKVLQFVESYQRLRFDLLGARPAPATPVDPNSSFCHDSKKKEVGASARRFVLATQSRGLHLHLAPTASIEDHATIVDSLEHPFVSAMKLLPSQWLFVFEQFRAAIRKFGFHGMTTRVNKHRASVVRWLRTVATDLQPIQREMRALMPPSADIVSGHVNFPLLYVLLTLTEYPNPDFAFRFLVGAPLVGQFSSPALPPRHIGHGSLSDRRIRQLARECKAREKYVVARLDKEAAIKSHLKFKKELISQTIVANFRSRDELRLAIIKDIRQAHGMAHFHFEDEDLIVSTQFSVIESHAYAETEEEKLQMKVRNIFNGRILNGLAESFSTYIPHSHADIAAILGHWSAVMSSFLAEVPPVSFQGWPADFASAYRQMPLSPIQVMFSGFVYYDYEKKERRYGFYRALPFGSSLAPAEWSETCTALAHLAAVLLCMILTHCIDDVCNIEMEQTVASARTAFLLLVELLGLRLDPDKCLAPSADFIYLGLRMLLPAAIPRQPLSFCCPEIRRSRLISHCQQILKKNSLTPAEASSMRGRLFFYCYWHQEARSYLVYLARRQYAHSLPSTGHIGSHLAIEAAHENVSWPLTEELRMAFRFFLNLLESSHFKKGILPERYLNRLKAIVYTDGSRSEAERGIGGVAWGRHLETVFFAEDLEDDYFYPHIAVVEMRAILRAIRLFGHSLRGRAVIFFVDNTHALGCLLKRSSSLGGEGASSTYGVRTNPIAEPYGVQPHGDFEALSDNIKYSMNHLSRDIWNAISEFDLLVWWEYVNTHSNAADPPSRGFWPHCGGHRLGHNDKILQSYDEFCVGKRMEAALKGQKS